MKSTSQALRRSALIVSPFATWPTDAGHRRRTYQVTQLLKEAGFHVTFLLFAFEDHWYWRHDEAACAALREQWDEVHVVYADRKVGLPPKSGAFHQLDEWWDADLEATLRNLAGRRHFDVAVVHNVWLSKALDFLPRRTVKVIETHDIFWKRPEVFRRMGLAPEFFVCNRSDEVFGLQRADIVVAIQEKEGAELLNATTCTVVTVPFYDPALESEAPRLDRRDYLHPDKVSFGFLASANAFNVAGLNALVHELQAAIGRTFAPVELVIGGRVGEHVRSTLDMRKLGRVETEAAFYEQVDFAIAPVFEGTGFKIKTADALALQMPSLFSQHSAEGTVLEASLRFSSPAEMAAAMVEISLRRPAPVETRLEIARAGQALRASTAAGAAAFIAQINRRMEAVVVDLSSADPVSDALVLQSFLSQLRVFSDHCPVLLALSPAAYRVVGRILPLGVKAAPVEEVALALAEPGRPAVTLLDVLGRGSALEAVLRPDDRVLWDKRWSAQPREDAPGAFGDLPAFHSNLLWEPAPAALRRLLQDRSVNQPGRQQEVARLVFVEGDLPGMSRGAGEWSAPRGSYFVRVDRWENLQYSILSLHWRKPGKVVWAAPASGIGYRAALETCVLLKIPFQGLVDAAAYHEGSFSPHLQGELDRRVPAAFQGGMVVPTSLASRLAAAAR